MRIPQFLFCAVMACALGVLTAPAGATIHVLTTNMDGLQEVPPVATPAYGDATLTVDDVLMTWSLSGNFYNLIGTSSNAHIHGPAAIGVSAGVLLPLTYTSGVSSGSLSGGGALTAVQLGHILSEMTYVNVHSTFRPGGEIRGQLLVPEPATLGLLAIGSLVAARRRRTA